MERQSMDEVQAVSHAEERADAQAAADLRRQAVEMGREAASFRLKTLVQEAEALKAQIAEEQEGDTTPVDLWYQYDALMDRIEEAKDSLYSLVSLALDGRYSPEDVKGWCSRAVEMGCVHPTIGGALLEDLLYVRKIPNAPFREHVLTEREAGRIPMANISPHEESTISRRMGLRSIPGSPGHNDTMRIFITYEQGVDLAQRFGMTPQQAGI
jgi:hypothetical protein